jgi:hypothetical protein
MISVIGSNSWGPGITAVLVCPFVCAVHRGAAERSTLAIQREETLMYIGIGTVVVIVIVVLVILALRR